MILTLTRTRTISAVDLFCGAGGSSSGLLKAASMLGLDVDLLAVNCWQIAINTHRLNHPGVRHLCQTLETVKPREVVPGGHLDLLLASPECTHQSRARGGKPINDQSRSTAWRVVEWLDALTVDHVIIENVPEFREWGPLDSNNRPIQSKKGTIYRRFLSVIRAMGYTVEDRILNAADYGDATTRKRLFIQARRGRGKISWPEPTHIRPGQPRLAFMDSAKPWRTAREIIDWSLVGESIYNRKRPLAPNTIRRIMAGLEKYGGLPFIQCTGHNQSSGAYVYGADRPMPTITTADDHALVEPYLVILKNNCDARSLDAPVPTLCAGGNHVAVAQPFLVKSYLGSDAASLDAPLPTVTAGFEHFALAEPVVINMKGQSVGRGIDQPVPTVTAHAPHLYLADPYLVSYHGSHAGARDGDGRVMPIDEPLRTLDTSNRYAVARPFVVKYHGTGGAHSVDEPLDTITTRDRYALVSPELVHQFDGNVVGWLDIRFRMLQPHELAAAMSFPSDYEFTGTREAKVRQIGNAVPVQLSAALCGAALGSNGRLVLGGAA